MDSHSNSNVDASVERGLRSRRSQKKSRGSVLVCVMLVLFVTGMMTLQGTRLLVAASRTNGQRARLEQMQEFLSLGRMRLAQEFAVRGDDYSGETFVVEAPEGTTNVPAFVELRIEGRAGNADALPRWRVIATYPFEQADQTTATWEQD